MLNRSSVVDDVRNRRYLLEKTQHLVGGFGKVPGDPPGKAKKRFPQRRIDMLTQSRSSPLMFWPGIALLPRRGRPRSCRSCAGHDGARRPTSRITTVAHIDLAIESRIQPPLYDHVTCTITLQDHLRKPLVQGTSVATNGYPRIY